MSNGQAEKPPPRRGSGAIALVKHLRGEGFTAIDATSHERVGTVGGGRQPHAVAVHPSGRWAYVPYMASGLIEVLDLRELSVAATVDAGAAPVGAALAGDGGHLVVSTYGPLAGGDEAGVAVFETDAETGCLRPVERFELGRCAGIAAVGGNDVWVARRDANAIVRLSGPSFSVGERIEVPGGPETLAYAPERDLLGVNCVDADRVAFVDADAGRRVGETAAPNPRGGTAAAGRWFVADTEGDGLTAVDLDATERQAERVSLGTPVAFTDASPDGRWLVADAEADERVTFLDPETLVVLARVRTGARPHHPRFTPDGGACYVPNADADTVTVLDMSPLEDGAPPEPITEITVPDGAGPSGCYLAKGRWSG